MESLVRLLYVSDLGQEALDSKQDLFMNKYKKEIPDGKNCSRSHPKAICQYPTSNWYKGNRRDDPHRSWSTGTYATYPIALGSGTIESASIAAEQGKVHLSNATQALLRYLMEAYGIPDATANTVATNIVSYRGSNPFDSVEELKQVTGMTDAIYNAIDQDITVYSYINPYVQGPERARAPININLASAAVLRAIFSPLTFNNGTDITNLVNAIIAQRNVAPFTCFYSANSAVSTDFYDFERAQSYLSNAEDDRVLGNADASLLVPRSGGSNQNALTTEFSYDTNVFRVESVSNISGRKLRIKTAISDQGSRTFTTYNDDVTSTGYWRENFE